MSIVDPSRGDGNRNEEVLPMSDRPASESVRPDFAAKEEYGRLSDKHRKCEERLSELRERLFLSEQEKLEEVNLKKHKLSLKDRMEAIAREFHEAGLPKSG